jgi:hypothetical protein
VLHVASQIDILCDRLTEILNNHNEEQLRITIIKNLIAKHQRIISLFENVESVFTLISLLQFFFNTVVICFVGFLLVTVSKFSHQIEKYNVKIYMHLQ